MNLRVSNFTAPVIALLLAHGSGAVRAQDVAALAEALDLPGFTWEFSGPGFAAVNDDPAPDTDYINLTEFPLTGVWLKVTIAGPGVISCVSGDLDRTNVQRLSVRLDGTEVRYRWQGPEQEDFIPVPPGTHVISWHCDNGGFVPPLPVRCPLNRVKFTPVFLPTGEILGAPQLTWTTSTLFPWVADIAGGNPPTRMMGGYVREWNPGTDLPSGISWLRTTLPARSSIRFQPGGWLNFLTVDDAVARFWIFDTPQNAELHLAGNAAATVAWVQHNDECIRLPSFMTLANVQPQPAAPVTLPEAIGSHVPCVLENTGPGPGWEYLAGGCINGGDGARILAPGGLHLALWRPDYPGGCLKFWWKVEGGGSALAARGETGGLQPDLVTVLSSRATAWEPGSVFIADMHCYNFRPVRFSASSGSHVLLDRLEYVTDSGQAWLSAQGLWRGFYDWSLEDGDQLDLFAEYAFGGDPRRADQPPALHVETSADGSLRLTFQLPAWSTADVTYWIEESADLLRWTAFNVPDRTNVPGEVISTRVAPAAGSRYFRLRAARG